MILNTILGLVIISATTLIGFKFSDKKKFRTILYAELLSMCNNLKSEINFSHNTICRFLNNLSPVINSICKNSIKNFINGEAIQINDKRLTYEENSEISQFINSLGVTDTISQNEILSYYSERFKMKFNECDEVYKKFASFYVKMGALIGIILFILIF